MVAKVLTSANILGFSISVFYLVPCLKILGGKEMNHTEPESDCGSQIQKTELKRIKKISLQNAFIQKMQLPCKVFGLVCETQ